MYATYFKITSSLPINNALYMLSSVFVRFSLMVPDGNFITERVFIKIEFDLRVNGKYLTSAVLKMKSLSLCSNRYSIY